MALVFAFLPGLLIPILVVVQQLAHRRLGRRLDLRQVIPALFSQFQGLLCQHHTELFAVFINQTNFPVANFLIDHQLESDIHTPPKTSPHKKSGGQPTRRAIASSESYQIRFMP